MRDFAIVFKILFKNEYSFRVANNGKRKLPQGVTTLLCMIPVAVLICIVAGFLASIIPDVSTLSMVSNVIMSAVQLFALLVSMFGVMNSLYNSPDTPFLNTLPVRHTAVFFAKFATAYISTLSFTAALLIPSLLTISIVYASLGRAMFYGYFALIFLVALASPILPLFVITLFSMPISYLGTFFKGRSTLKTVLTLLFYVAIMVGYFLIMLYVSKTNETESSPPMEMTANALAGLGVFSKVMYPNKVLLDFCLGIDAGKNFGISFAIIVGMAAIMLLLAMLFYRRINERRLETHTESSKSAVSYKQSNIISALMMRDFKQIIRNPNLAMSSLANILICPVLTAIMFFMSDKQIGEEAPVYLNSMLKLSYIVLYSLIFLGGTNTMAMIAYTREGRSFYQSKTLPISAKDSIKAKFILALIPSGIVLIIQIILALALYRLDVLSVALFTVCTALIIVGATGLHIYCDMRFGNVNWSTRQDLKQVSSGNKGSIIVSFLAIAIGLFAMIGGMVLSAFAEQIGGETVALAVFWSVLGVLSIAMFVAGVLVIKYHAEPYFDEIGERRFKEKAGRASKKPKNGGNMLIR